MSTPDRGLIDETALTMIDPTAVIAASATFGAGCYVGPASVVSPGSAAGVGCLVNRSCSLGHHTTLGDYVTTGPGIVVAGSCRIEDGAFLGAGCVLAPELRVGESAVWEPARS
jgi:UDP-3-O-[3-hydroxymyristoyl] glucosamine N-acyltransferase